MSPSLQEREIQWSAFGGGMRGKKHKAPGCLPLVEQRPFCKLGIQPAACIKVKRAADTKEAWGRGG